MSEKIRVVVSGALGRMGLNAVETVLANSDKFELIAGVVRDLGNVDPKVKADLEERGCRLSSNLKAELETGNVDVLVELTTPRTVFTNSEMALKHGVRPVIGATGLTEEDIQHLSKLSSQNEIGAIIAPNFAIGAILMMQFAKQATQYFDKYEIIELHHDKKLDAPSGTAIKTAQAIEAIAKNYPHKQQIVPTHSVRLPGIVANQEVIFGGVGQTLTIKHDTIDRSSFMPGIMLCAEKVMGLKTLVYGMENIL